ncbi:hypothetical protein FRC01_013436 [Tulasnella sp. 417]|nr:hypothetical protein FRC01_013436 [Tulasnella sp. 417]
MSLQQESSPPPLVLDQDSAGASMAIAAAVAPQVNPVPWISFSGRPKESAASLIQSMQRVAFLQNRIEDDKWIAQYASTCFTDSALVWYLGLEKDTRSSWEKLRLALVQRYPVQATKPTPAFATASTALPDPVIPDTGRIEVVQAEFGDVFGFLSQSEDSWEDFVIDPNPEKALTLQMVLHPDSQQQSQKIYSLKMTNPADPKFPFLGLRLVKFRGEDPDVVPPTESKDVAWNAIKNVADCCKPSEKGLGSVTVGQDWRSRGEENATAYATWEFIASTESRSGPYYVRKAEASGPARKARVVSAVWTILNPLTDATELGLTWPGGYGRRGSAIPEIALDLS